MAGIFKMNSFVGKFVSLWKAGRNASLKLDSEAGKARLTLQLDLGHPVLPQHLHLNTYMAEVMLMIGAVSEELMLEKLTKK